VIDHLLLDLHAELQELAAIEAESIESKGSGSIKLTIP